MKNFRFALPVIFFSLLLVSAFFIAGCSNDNKNTICTQQQIVIYDSQTDLPEIKIDEKPFNWNDFYFENKDNYVYVYNGKIYMVENSPNEFTTKLNVFFKKDKTIST